MFLLVKALYLAMFKLPLLLLMTPFKILGEVLERSGHRRHHQHHSRRRTAQPMPQHQPRQRRAITWLPGLTGLTRWSRQVTQAMSQPGRTPVQRYLLTPAAVLAVMGAWVGLVYVWLLWWMLMPIVLCVELAA